MATSGTEQGNRLMEVVAAEGRELEEDFSRIEAETGPEERRRLADQLLRAAGRPHGGSAGGALPAASAGTFPTATPSSTSALLGLDQIERTSKEFDGLSGAEPSFHPLVTKLATEVWEHLDEEEGEVLPAVVDAIGVDAANELGDALARAGAGVRQ